MSLRKIYGTQRFYRVCKSPVHVGSCRRSLAGGAITEPYGSHWLFACLVEAIWAEAIQIALVTLAGGRKELSS